MKTLMPDILVSLFYQVYCANTRSGFILILLQLPQNIDRRLNELRADQLLKMKPRGPGRGLCNTVMLRSTLCIALEHQRAGILVLCK